MDAIKTQALRDLLKDKSLLKEQCYIDGKWVDSDDKIDVTTPASGDVIAAVPKLGAKETKQAIEEMGDVAEDGVKGDTVKVIRIDREFSF